MKISKRSRGPSLLLKRHLKDAVCSFGAQGATTTELLDALRKDKIQLTNDERSQAAEILCNISTQKLSTANIGKPLIRLRPARANRNEVVYVHSKFLTSRKCYLCGKVNETWELIGGGYGSTRYLIDLRRCLTTVMCEMCFRKQFLNQDIALSSCVGVAVLPLCINVNNQMSDGNEQVEESLQQVIESFGFVGASLEEVCKLWWEEEGKISFTSRDKSDMFVMDQLFRCSENITEKRTGKDHPPAVFRYEQLNVDGGLDTLYFAGQFMYDQYNFSVQHTSCFLESKEHSNSKTLKFRIEMFDTITGIKRFETLRSLEDFCWLRKELVDSHSDLAYVPMLPHDWNDRNSCRHLEETLATTLMGLESFLRLLSRHTVLSVSPSLIAFLQETSMEIAKKQLTSLKQNRLQSLQQQRGKRGNDSCVSLLRNLKRLQPQIPTIYLRNLLVCEEKPLRILCSETHDSLEKVSNEISNLKTQLEGSALQRLELATAVEKLAYFTNRMTMGNRRNRAQEKSFDVSQMYLTTELFMAVAKLHSNACLEHRNAACTLNNVAFHLSEWKRCISEFTFVTQKKAGVALSILNEVGENNEEENQYDGVDSSGDEPEEKLERIRKETVTELNKINQKHDKTLAQVMINFAQAEIEKARNQRLQWQDLLSYVSEDKRQLRGSKKRSNCESKVKQSISESFVLNHSVLARKGESYPEYHPLIDLLNGNSSKQGIGRLSNDVNIQVALSVARGLAALHSENYVHGNLSSANVLVSLSPKTEVKLSGYNQDPFDNEYQSWIENSPWMAPEMLTSRKPAFSKAADIYNFGLLLFQLFTREPLYVKVHATKLRFGAALEGKRPVLVPRTVPEKMEVLISSCWNQDPAERPDIESILASLETKSDITC